MKPIKLYKVEVGVFLKKEHPDYKDYAKVYDKQHAYYDENVVFFRSKRNAKEYLKNYVFFGVVNTYGILSELEYDPQEIYGNDHEKYAQSDLFDIDNSGIFENYVDVFGGNVLYGVKNVIFTRYKKSNKTFRKIF